MHVLHIIGERGERQRARKRVSDEPLEELSKGLFKKILGTLVLTLLSSLGIVTSILSPKQQGIILNIVL